MPLARVRHLVKHASVHGYLVVSFTVRRIEEVQAVVNAAETARAPAIIAVEGQCSTFLDNDIKLAVSASVAASASVPIAVEVVSQVRQGTLISSRSDGAAVHVFSPTEDAALYAASRSAVRQQDPEQADCEMWFDWPGSVAIPETCAAGCRLGVAVGETGTALLRPAAFRRQLQALNQRHDGPLVIDGDLPWSSGTFRSFVTLGVAKINVDKRLGSVMAKANRRAAQKVGDHYHLAVEETISALTAEVSECLRRAGGSGRAADVLACAADDEPDPAAVEAYISFSNHGGRRTANVVHKMMPALVTTPYSGLGFKRSYAG